MTELLRTCSSCKVERPLDMFYVSTESRRSANMGRRITYPCRICRRKVDAERRQPRQDYADQVKMAAGCADCGLRSDHPEIYDFDHLPDAEKISSVALLLTRGSMEGLKAEIAKCEVVCANCHRIRTRARGHNGFGRDWPTR